MPTTLKRLPRKSGVAVERDTTRSKDREEDVEEVSSRSSKLVLPTTKSVAASKLEQQTTLIYGEPGIGKSSLLSQFNTLFLMFEPGVKNLEVYKLPSDKPCFSTWKEFIPWVDIIAKDDRYQNVVFDTAEWAYRRATEHVCKINAWDHVSDAGFAKGYDRADEEFALQIGKLANKGIFFTSHVKVQPHERPNGTKYDRLMPNLTGRGHAFIVGLCDVIMYYGYSGQERRVFIGGNDFILTKCKPKNNFWTTDDERVVSIPAGEDEEEAFTNLMAAWNNEQEDAGEISSKINPEKRLTKAKFKK